MKPKESRVVVFGSINVDRTAQVDTFPVPGETVTAKGYAFQPGGKSANQAVAAAKLGATVLLVGTVGDDPEGRWVRDAIAGTGVDVVEVSVATGTPTGQALVLVDDAGENCIVVLPGANERVVPDRLTESVLAEAGVLVLCLEVSDAVVSDAATRACSAGVPVILNLSPLRPVAQELLECVDVLVVNRHELQGLVGKGRAWRDDVEQTLDLCGVHMLVVTLGADGAAFLERGQPVRHQPGISVSVVDTTGCGDAFLGALASEIVRGRSIPDALPLAVAVGAHASKKIGAQNSYPTRAELAPLLDHAASPTATDR